MANVFDVESAQKTITEVGKLTNELAAVEEKRKALRGELKARKTVLKQLLAGPRKERKAAEGPHRVAVR
jgi:hypothetical protein